MTDLDMRGTAGTGAPERGGAGMPKQADPARILRQWRQAERYNENIGLAEEVQKSEDFYIGDQWKGLNAPDLDKPVFNILKRVGSFFIASIVSDDIGIRMEAFDSQGAEMPAPDGMAMPAAALGGKLPGVLSRQLEEAMEQMKIKPLHRYFLRDSLVDGDGCIHFYFDPDRDPQGFARSGMYTPGSIACELLDNTNVYFGNPQSIEVEAQPWIIIQFRVPVEQAQERARAAGSAEWEQITSDKDGSGANLDEEDGKAAVLRKYWLEGGAGDKTLWFAEIDSRGHVVTPARGTRQTRYPLVWMPWERVKNRYHGKGAVSAMLPNQIIINKTYAMTIESVKKTAFTKIIYNKNMIPHWSNRVGEAIAVNGDPNQAIVSSFKAAEMSPQIVALLGNVMSATKDTMGASDASLGNVTPENTSAIVAVQQATSMPLDLQKQDFYRVVEEEVRIWLDMMNACYGIRPVKVMLPDPAAALAGGYGMDDGAGMGQGNQMEGLENPAGGVWPGDMGPGAVPGMGTGTAPGTLPGMAPETPKETEQVIAVDFSGLGDVAMKLHIDIGSASYWSEINEITTLDNLFKAGLIDGEQYIERLPEGYVKDKGRLIEELRERNAMQGQLAAMGGGMPAPAAEGGMAGAVQ